MIDGDQRVTWAELGAGVEALASALSPRVAAGDRVAVMLPNGRRFLELSFAVAGLGAILVPLNTRAVAAEIAAVVADADPVLLVAARRFAPQLTDQKVTWADALEEVEGGYAPRSVALDGVAQIYYTSGTTGAPKGVMLTHRNLASHTASVIEELNLTSGDVWAHIAPMFHLADAWATCAITAVAGTHVMCPTFEPKAALDLIRDRGVTLTNLVPTMLNLMVKHDAFGGLRFPALRVILSGGAPIAPDLVRRIVAGFGCDYIQTYGMTETSPYLTLSILPPELLGLPLDEQLEWKARTGRPFKGIDLEVVGDDGAQVPVDGATVGEIRVRGATVTPGYWRRPEATEAAFRDGWLMTGDLAVRHGHGFVDIVDRKKDMIITGGENVYSTEVEAVLYEHAAVLEAAVFGLPDSKWGERVVAAIVLRCPASEESLMDHCRRRLAGYKVPRAILFMESLPRTGSGKIAKRALRSG